MEVMMDIFLVRHLMHLDSLALTKMKILQDPPYLQKSIKKVIFDTI